MSFVSAASELLAISRAEQTHFKCRCSINWSTHVDNESSIHRIMHIKEQMQPLFTQ